MIITSKKLFTKILKGYTGITIFPFIILRDSKLEMSEERYEILINHEKIHLRQQIEMLVIFFYIMYGFYFIKNIIKGMPKFQAYRNIPFEKESYANEKNLKYLESRELWSWTKYTK